MYMPFRCLDLSFIFSKLRNEISAGLGCFCLCFFCADFLLLPLKVSENSVTDSSGNESASQLKFSPWILIPPPDFLFR